MLYNSFEFLFVFLPICLAVYFLAAKVSRGLANSLLVLLSFQFYIWNGWKDPFGHWRNLIVIAVSIAMNYLLGLWLRSGNTGKRSGKFILILGLALNLAGLAYFKYANFLLGNYASLTHGEFHALKIALPLGISFFTFTQIAFLVDAYQGKAREMGLARYCLFVAFFPHLIAGPIVHHSELMPQFALPEAKKWNHANFYIGLTFLTLGLFGKVMIADTCAPWADEVFNKVGPVSQLDAWRGAIAYTLQIYFDFSGYSNMAIGLGLMFNVRLPDNFNNPYRAVSIVDFWRRWHMTLSRFLRDYLYIPLGGNRHGEFRRQTNLLITMFLGGIWHGAGWTFAVWGAYHGVLLSLNHGWSKLTRNHPLPKFVSRPLTFAAVVAGWVFFRATNLPLALNRLRTMFFPLRTPSRPIIITGRDTVHYAVLLLLLFFINVAPNARQWIERHPLNNRRALLLGVMFFLCAVKIGASYSSDKPQPFIYFNF